MPWPHVSHACRPVDDRDRLAFVQATKQFAQREWLKNKMSLCHPKRQRTKAAVTLQKAFRAVLAVKKCVQGWFTIPRAYAWPSTITKLHSQKFTKQSNHIRTSHFTHTRARAHIHTTKYAQLPNVAQKSQNGPNRKSPRATSRAGARDFSARHADKHAATAQGHYREVSAYVENIYVTFGYIYGRVCIQTG